MSTNFLRGLNPIIEKLSEELDIPQEHIELLVDNYFKKLRLALNDPRVPKIKIPWGEFRLSTKKIVQKQVLAETNKKRWGTTVPEKIAALRKRFIQKLLHRDRQEGCQVDTYKEWHTVRHREEMARIRKEERELSEKWRIEKRTKKK